MREEVLFDAQGRVSGLLHSWLFDEVYTSVVTKDIEHDDNGKPTAAGLDDFARASMQNLAGFHYLTRAASGAKDIPFGSPQKPSARMVGDRLELTFKLPLNEPVGLKSQAFTYSVYDPTYYIEMLHAQNKDAIQLVGVPPGCDYQLIKPKPDPAKVMEAAALDFTHGTDDSLGAFFAERVVVRCDAPQ